ncbi:uncharacterized protein LOC112270742 [Brachypodium distachyon]|uniref:uncharacterized protein LOC112270742 n=1 Tax=Brachypodium distachyon TaxID=15368 RepID=UPI000D0E0CD2|nr:uncharacterized protein LOC112270742 [Brachypodium distachyon]|eukprot:XP_024314584.1 uncharacterized protein LOC112270742 [Brachypodium distachyon]
MAHTELEFALERSSKLPITDTSLLRRRRMLKRAHEECRQVLYRHKLVILQVQETEETDKSRVKPPYSFPAPGKIIRAVKSYFFSPPGMDELSCSRVVGRFEWFADKAGKFVREVESGCSLAHYRFINPLVAQLLQGKNLKYDKAQGNRKCHLMIEPARSEEHGVVAMLWLRTKDSKMPTSSFNLVLMLRLSESTDAVGIATDCLLSLGPQFRSSAQVVAGEFAEMPTEDVFHHPSAIAGIPLKLNISVGLYRPDPLCCLADGHRPFNCAAFLFQKGALRPLHRSDAHNQFIANLKLLSTTFTNHTK